MNHLHLQRGPAGRARPLFFSSALALRAALLILVVGLAAALRLPNLAQNPGWYTDEGAHLDIAWHLSQGQLQFLAITQSTLWAARLPLFELLLAAVLRLPGEGLTLLRALTGSLGVVSAGLLGLLVWVGREPRPLGPETALAHRGLSPGEGLAWLAAGLLAIYPPAVLYSRFGFSYNLLTPLVLITGLGLLKYWEVRRWRWLLLAALAVGLGLVSEVWMGVMGVAVLLGVYEHRWPRWRLRALAAGGVMLLPVGVYALLMLWMAPQAFLFDLRFTLGRLNAIPLGLQAGVLADNVWVLGRETPWFVAGLAGLLALPSRLRRVSGVLFGVPFVLLGRTTALYSLSFYYLIPLLPFVSLGIAALFWRAGQWALRWPARWGMAPGLVKALLAASVAGFVGVSFVQTYTQVWAGFVTPIDAFLINPDQARAAAVYVNAQVQPGDVVIASPGLAWLVCGRGSAVRCQVADFQMAVAAAGEVTPHVPANLSPERWAFDPRLAQARYVVVDNLWRNWAAVYLPPVAALLRAPALLHAPAPWQVVFEAGDVIVYYAPPQ